VFPPKDVPLGVSFIVLPILEVKSHKNPYFGVVNRHFQASRQSQTWYCVCLACHYCQLMIVCALQDIRITIATNRSHSRDAGCSFSNWWRTSSASGLTGVLLVQIASVFVINGCGRATSTKVIILALACVGIFKLATRTCSTS